MGKQGRPHCCSAVNTSPCQAPVLPAGSFCAVIPQNTMPCREAYASKNLTMYLEVKLRRLEEGEGERRQCAEGVCVSRCECECVGRRLWWWW